MAPKNGDKEKGSKEQTSSGDKSSAQKANMTGNKIDERTDDLTEPIELDISDFEEKQITSVTKRHVTMRGAQRQVMTKAIKSVQALMKAEQDDECIEFPSDTLIRTLKAKSITLSNTKQKLLDLDNEIQSVLEGEILIQDLEQSNYRQEILNEQIDIINDLLEGSKKLKQGKEEQIVYNTSTNESNSGYKLPDLELPHFDDKIVHWQNFYENFVASIHNDPKLSTISKFQYLLSLLKGDAKNYISGFKVEASSYQPALDRLLEEFDNRAKVVETYILRILNLPSPQFTYAELSKFKSEVECNIRTLASLNIIGKEEGTSIILATILSQKLPPQIKNRVNWVKAKKNWDLDLIRSSLGNALIVLEAEDQHLASSKKGIDGQAHYSNKSFNKSSSKSTTFAVNNDAPNDNEDEHFENNSLLALQCTYCQGSHVSHFCSVYPTSDVRYQRARELQLCFNCLSSAHFKPNCTSKYACQICNMWHHTSLCQISSYERYPANSGTKKAGSDSSSGAYSTICNSSTNVKYGVALPTAQFSIKTPKGFKRTRAIFDQCSQSTLILDSFVRSSGLRPNKTTYLSINGINKCTPKQLRDIVTVPVRTPIGIIELEAIIVQSLPTNIYVPGLKKTANSLRRLHICLADLYVGDNIDDISILVGADQYPLFCDLSTNYINNTNVIPTCLGNMIYGTLPYKGFSPSALTNIATVLHIGLDYETETLNRKVFSLETQYKDISLPPKSQNEPTNIPLITLSSFEKFNVDQYMPFKSLEDSFVSQLSNNVDIYDNTDTIKQDLDIIWSLDSIGISTNEMSPFEKQAVSDFENHLIYKNGQYFARLLWKPNHPTLPDNYGLAKACLYSNLKRLLKNRNHLNFYDQIFKEQLSRDFIEEVTPSTLIYPEAKLHYLPPHGIAKDSNTTPLRIVYNCSAGKVSLNSCLFSGPSYVADLCKVLLRFRLHAFATVSDMEKAFLKIGLSEEDRDSTRFLWLRDPTDLTSPIVTYRFKVILFGSTCSQFILNAAVKHHLENSESPFASKLLSSLYIDNLISTFPTEGEITKYYHAANEIMSRANLNYLREWSSNSESARSLFRQYDNHTEEGLIKVLGMVWNNTQDTITYPKRTVDKFAKTKREVLKTTATIFDPIGHIVPVVIRARMFLQKLWKCKLRWDQIFDPDLQNEWTQIAEDLEHALAFNLPRQLIFEGNVLVHIFGDASQRAYGGVAYIVCNEHSNIILAKAKVSPVKELSIPKLELTAATLVARMANYIKETYKSLINILEFHLWSDSKATLQWIHSTKPQKFYIQNRIDEIHKVMPNATWHYVSTSDNPSDLLSRGMSAQNLLKSELWKHGPDFLTSPSNWPQWDPNYIEGDFTILTTIADDSITVYVEPILVYNKYSTFEKLLKVTMLVRRFITNLRSKQRDRKLSSKIGSNFFTHKFSLEEKTTSERYWIILIQREFYNEEYDILSKGKATRSARIISFNLFMDNGIIRCKRRIDYSNLPYDTKFPILLPSRHHITTLLIRDYHLENHHVNVSQLMLALQQRYHIPQMRQSIKRIIRPCVLCKRLQGVHYPTPPAPPLPSSRVTASRPFSNIGLDYTGALFVRNLKKRIYKVYIVLFSCFVTRAVHLEVVEDNTKDSFLLALRRFVGRRGVPSQILSDNSTTFVSSADYLKSMQTLPSVRQYLLDKGIMWKFIASRSPHLGAVYERLIGVIKSCLRKTLGNALVTYTELYTIVTEVEQYVNCRPLTHVGDELTIDNVLTPSRLIYGYDLTSLPIPIEQLDPDETYGVKPTITERYKYVLSLLNSIWRSWNTSYLTSLRQHSTARGKSSVEVGDVVLVFEECSRLKWKLGRVTNLRTGQDGYVRSVDLDTANGPTSRATIKLYPLEINETTNLDSSTSNGSSPIERKLRPKREAASQARKRIAMMI